MDPITQPFKDLYGDLSIQPNQRIGFHADARYNVHNFGLREATRTFVSSTRVCLSQSVRASTSN